MPTAEVLPPRYDPDELCGVVPVDARQPYDVREVIARVVDDGSELLDLQGGFGTNTVCGHGDPGGVSGWASSATTVPSCPRAQ